MSTQKPNSKKSELEVVRTNTIAQLDSYPAASDEYENIIKHIDVLSKLIDATKREKLSPNTIAVVLGNIGIAGMVLWFERENVLNTKMFSFFSKTKG